jgi:hypothetical protein
VSSPLIPDLSTTLNISYAGYRSLAPIYFRNSAAAVIVYDITQVRPLLSITISTNVFPQSPDASFEKAKSWVQTLQRQADPGIIIILVGNKLDLVQDDPSARRVTREEAERYAEAEGLLFAEASAKTGEGVSDIFMKIGESHVHGWRTTLMLFCSEQVARGDARGAGQARGQAGEWSDGCVGFRVSVLAKDEELLTILSVPQDSPCQCATEPILLLVVYVRKLVPDYIA